MILLLLAIAGITVLVGFIVLEERRRPEIAVFLVVGVTVVDTVLFAHQGDVPIGPFRPSFGGQDLRTADVLIPVALAARLLVRGLPRRLTAEGLVWTTFLGWYVFAGLVGVVRGQPVDLVLFQGKFVLETGGMIALVAGVPLSLLADSKVIGRLGRIGGIGAALLLPMAATGVSVGVPLLAGARFGTVSPDAATVLVSLGVLVVVAAACADRVNGSVLLGGAAMMATPFVTSQRAAIVGTVPVIVAVGLAMGGATWRRRSPVRVAALTSVVALLLLPIGALTARAATGGEGVAAAPLVERLSDTFGSEQKQASADVRVGLLREGRALTGERPVIGQGLGQPVLIFGGRPEDAARVIGDFHNIAVDVAVRTGLTGLALFLVAMSVSLLAALRRWSSLAHDLHAALVLAAGAAVGGLLVKGMFETIFQKFRLAVLLGLLVGIIASAADAARQRDVALQRDRGVAWT